MRNTSDSDKSYYYSAWLKGSVDDELSLADLGWVEGIIEPGMTETVSIQGVFDDSVLSYPITPGEYVLHIALEDNRFREFNIKVSDIPSGIEGIDSYHSLEQSRFYDLSGRQVNTTGLTPDVYIKVSSNARENILIK